MTDPRSPLWWEDAGAPFSALTHDRDADVIVIGGGIAGLTLAWSLREQGAYVALLEAGRVAGAASGRNAGFLLAAPAEPYAEQVALWGRPGARAVLEAGRATHARVRSLIEQLGIACDYRQRGSVRLATSDEEAEDTRAGLHAQRADGFPMEEIALDEAVPAHAREAFRAAFFTAEDGEFHPVRFLHGLAHACAQRGVCLHEHSPVTHAQWRDGRWTVHTAAAAVRGNTVVLANNAWVPALCPALGVLIQPRRGQMLSTAPLTETVAPFPTYAHWGYRYWRQTPDGRLVIGGWRDVAPDAEVGDTLEVSDDVQRGIERGLATLVPGGAVIERRWAGTMAFARDGRPLVGWLDADHHLAICAGWTGHGMGMAAGCTQALAALLAWKEAPAITSFDPARFPELARLRAPVTVLGGTA